MTYHSPLDLKDVDNPEAWRFYLLLALFDTRDSSALSDLVRSAREGYERAAPGMDEEDAWEEFDRLWSSYTSSERLDLVRNA